LTHLLIADGRPVWPVFRYFQARNIDFATEATYAMAVGLLIDFVAANADAYADITRRSALFNAFAHAVLDGTVRDGDDPSGLWWHPRTTARTRKLVTLACEVSDWLAEHYGATPINPFTRYRIAGKYLDWYAADVAWREDKRRTDFREQAKAVLAAALAHPISRDMAGYWQRTRKRYTALVAWNPLAGLRVATPA
jgi:hypothetical protein